VACDVIAERWQDEQSEPTGAAFYSARNRCVEATLETIELQRTRLASLPDLDRSFAAGHAYALIEPLLEEHARSQDFAPPRTMHAAHWFDLLMQSPGLSS
jgi:hypothetical protein